MFHCASAVLISADQGRRARETLEVVVAKMGLHLAKPDDLAAQVALCRTAAVDNFVWCEPREQDFWVVHVRVCV